MYLNNMKHAILLKICTKNLQNGTR